MKILKAIRDAGKTTNLECLSSEAYNLDFERYLDHSESNEHRAEDLFENPKLKDNKKTVFRLSNDLPSIFRYFLDGSRRTYKIGDLIFEGKSYYPLVAGQVGVAVVEKNRMNKIRPVKKFCSLKNIIAFPDRLPKEDLSIFYDKISKECDYIKFDLVRYKVEKGKDLIDLAVAKIMSEMIDEEIAIVQKMAENDLLSTDRMLVIDGPLRFVKKLDLTQFRNVVGLSKSFKPTFKIGSGRKKTSVGAITSNLDFGERTTVFRTLFKEKFIGSWYLRLRNPRKIFNPLQGVVKLEVYAVDPDEKEEGLDSSRIDTISSFILKERNVTPYNSDSRWASHLYPIYLAETYLKKSFFSDLHFKALF